MLIIFLDNRGCLWEESRGHFKTVQRLDIKILNQDV